VGGETRVPRITYDRFWGAVLVLSCLLPARILGEGGGGRLRFLWHEFAGASAPDQRLYRAWLLLGTVAGAAALLCGALNLHAFWRHAANLLLGGATTALLFLIPSVRLALPFPAEATRPFEAVRALGPMVLVAAGVAYAGAGMRLARPSQVAGQLAGGLGALFLGVAFFLPGRAGAPSLFMESVSAGVAKPSPELVSRGVLLCAALLGMANLVRTRAEVAVARLTRLLLLGGFLYLVGALLWDEVAQGRGLRDWVLPYVWAAARALGPLFLCVDGLVAAVTIMITHGGD